MKSKRVLAVVCAMLVATVMLITSAQAYSALRAQDEASKVQTVKIILTDKGFEPASFTLKQDVPARITFVRQVEETCAKEVVFPDFKIKRELPLNEPVVVEITPAKTGEFGFACGMGMLKGKLVVQ